MLLKGTAQAELEGKKMVLEQGQYLHVPRGAWHRLSNPSHSADLVVAEVQIGKYENPTVAEEDIDRKEDDFDRL